MKTKVWVTFLSGGWILIEAIFSPLAAQQTVVVPDVNVNGDTIVVINEITINVLTDSIIMARFNDNMEALRVQLAEQECDCQGTATVVRVGQVGLVAMAFWMAVSLNKLAGKESVNNVDVEVSPHDVVVNVPERKEHQEDSEG